MLLKNASLRLSPVFTALLLGACGGGGSGDTTPVPTATTLGGTVAVGAPITGGTLRVLDANGDVVAADVPVDADGRYADIALTGPAPYRIEACGYAGPNYQCIYSVAQGAGTANVTPLTTALMLLASGQSPETLMTGTADGLDAASLSGAQDTLRNSLAPVLADAGVGSTLDLVSGSLEAGSRTGYDRVLDAVGVTTGVDGQPFVQIVPRLGSGNLYLESGSATVGTITSDSQASALPLAGLETLFRNMSLAARNATACADANAGMATLLSHNASLAMEDGEPLSGASPVAQGLCMFFGGQGSDEPAMWGSRFLSPTLGRCDFSGAQPVCGVSFVLQDLEGGVQPVGNGMGVSYESGAWKFKGDLYPVAINVNARVQRDRRIDGDAPVDSYSRALAFDVIAAPGLACAKVAQRNADGQAVTLAYFKRHPGDGVRRLSAWRGSNDGSSRSLDPLLGSTRSADDTWLMLPDSNAGDAAVRNFFRGGRTVTVSLYSNAACSTAFSVDGRNSFEIDVQGVPPVWASMPGLAWPELGETARAALRSLSVPASSTLNYAAAWGFSHGSVGVNGITLCSDRAQCGQGGSGRLADVRVSASATSATVPVQTRDAALAADGYKMLSIYGNTGDGIGMQSNTMSCPGVAAGQPCDGGSAPR